MRLNKKTRVTTEFWYELDFCCKELEDVYKIKDSPIFIYPEKDRKLLLLQSVNNDIEEYKEPSGSGLSMYGRQMFYCPFCGEKLQDEK